MLHAPFLSCPNTRLTFTAGHAATTKEKKKRSRKPKLPLTGARLVPTTGDTNTESVDFTTGPSALTPQLKVHANADATPENPSAEVTSNKRPITPSETPTGDDPVSGSVPRNKKRKRNEQKQNTQTTAGGGTDGTSSQSRSQSRDVSVAPTSHAEVDITTGVGEKPKKRRNYSRKKKGGDGQPAETGIQS